MEASTASFDSGRISSSSSDRPGHLAVDDDMQDRPALAIPIGRDAAAAPSADLGEQPRSADGHLVTVDLRSSAATRPGPRRRSPCGTGQAAGIRALDDGAGQRVLRVGLDRSREPECSRRRR